MYLHDYIFDTEIDMEKECFVDSFHLFPGSMYSSSQLVKNDIDGLVQDCSISIVNALEIPQSCAKPSIYPIKSAYGPVVVCFSLAV